METVTNVVSSASKLIWGESKPGEEPVNGQTGAGNVNEPYDKGNDVAGTTAIDSTPSTSNTATDPATSSSNTATESTTSPSTIDSATPNPSSTNPGSSGAIPHQKQQGADRPTEEPSAAQTETIKDKKDAAEDASTSKPHITSDEQREELAEKGELPKDPNDHSGEPMKMHAGGDPEQPVEGETTAEKTERSASVAQEGGGEHGKVKGTGEQWVKTSGVAAEGGDFDVTKPGAGREATRIMEEKGIKTEGSKVDPDADTKETSPGPEGKEKVSKIAKLKDKLHIGTGKHLG